MNFIHCFYWMPRFRAGKAEYNMWRRSDMGNSALIPEIDEITDTTMDKGVFALLSQVSSDHSINPFAIMNSQSLDGEISLENYASAHFGCAWDASAFCDIVQAVLQEQPRKCLLVAIWEDMQRKVIFKSSFRFARSLAPKYTETDSPWPYTLQSMDSGPSRQDLWHES